MADLPDWYTQVQSVAVEASSFRGGADASKPASPVAKDIYWATDTKILYLCVADGAWTGIDAATLVQGILTLYANLAGGGYRITNIADPTAAQDAATRAYVLAQLASYLLLSGGTLTGDLTISKSVPILNLVDSTGPKARIYQAANGYAYFQVLDSGASWDTIFIMEGGLATCLGWLYNVGLGTDFNANNYKITGLAAPVSDADAARKTDVDTVDARLDDVTQAQPVRVIGTIYQNSTKIRIVTVSIVLGGGSINFLAYTGSASPPTTLVASCSDPTGTTNNVMSATFIVLPNQYYKITDTGGGDTIAQWTEWDLH